jgi:anti-sigma regulatory factor (Ser/Thr protein kinase)
LALPSTVEAPALGRQALDEMLADAPRQTLQDAQLLLTEVLTNAIRHAGLGDHDHVSVLIRESGGAVDVEVANRGNGFDPRGSARSDRGAGWGLMLLDRLAEDWGVRRGGAEDVVVWFRVRSADL